MALTILTGSSQAAAFNYSYTTSGSADWASVPTASYFYDIVDKTIRFKSTNSTYSNVATASLALTASFYSGSVTSASYALTASYVLNAVSSSFSTTASYTTQALSSSYALTASYVLNAVSSSYAATASYSQNAADVILTVLNQSGAQINKGAVVRISGSNNASNTPRIALADYTNDSLSANTLGIVTNNIANGATGTVLTEGMFLGYDTSTPGWTSGQLVYLGASGSITGSAPLAPLHAVRLGQVIRVQSNNGSIYIRIDNGYELDELHDLLIQNPINGNLLTRSGSVWINSNRLTGSYELSGSITLEQGASIIPNDGQSGSIDLKAGPGGWAELQSNNSNQYVWVDDNGVYVGTNWSLAGKQWIFDPSGTLSIPGDINAAGYTITGSLLGTASTASFVTSSNVYGPYGADSVISSSYAATSDYATNSYGAIIASDATGIASAIASNADNYLLTATGTGQINGESTLTYDGTTLIAGGSFIQGEIGTATGVYSHVEGSKNNQANGDYSHAEGNTTIADGKYSHAEGSTTQTIGENSHTEGYNTSTGILTGYLVTTVDAGTCSLDSSYGDVTSEYTPGDIVILDDTHYSNVYGTMLLTVNSVNWNGTTTDVSFTDGTINLSFATIGNITTGAQNWAGGYPIGGQHSHAEGIGTIALGIGQHTSGKYNIPDATSLLIVGNGEDPNNRSDAFKVRKPGSIILPITSSGTPSWTGTDGEMIFGDDGSGNYVIHAWLGGAWRSGSLF